MAITFSHVRAAGIAAGLMAVSAAPAMAAEGEQSWWCKLAPSFCASDSTPGGVQAKPEESAGEAAPARSASEPAPAPAADAPPAAEPEPAADAPAGEAAPN